MTDAEFDLHVSNIKGEGYTVLPRTLTADECDTAIRELERLAAEKEQGGFECLFNKGRVFERPYQIAPLLRLIRHFLGADALLGGVFGSIIEQGSDAGGLHADGETTGHLRSRSQAAADDGRRITSHVMSVNTIFCLSEFTSTNGATRLVPGSHHTDTIGIPETAVEQTRIVEAARGSTILFDTNVWHGTSQNSSDAKRYALLVPWRRSWQKGGYELARLVKPEVVERAGEDGPLIFGFDAMPPYLELWQWDREKGAPKPEFSSLRRD